MNTILVPLDGSPQATQVLPFASLIARLTQARICLLRVIDERLDGVPTLHDVTASYGAADGMIVPDPVSPTLDVRRQQLADEHFSTVMDLRAQGLEVELRVEVGHPAEVIVEQAAAKQVQLIAMATHGWSGLRRWALGSVTDKVIQVATVPVLVVRNDGTTTTTNLRRILVPIDQSPLSHKALPLATELAAAADAHMMLLSVLAMPVFYGGPDPYLTVGSASIYADPDPEQQARLMADLQTLAEQIHTSKDVSLSCDVQSGLPADVIVEVADERNIDLIVMATHGYSGLRRWALGSVADKVIHAMPCPVLLVRATE